MADFADIQPIADAIAAHRDRYQPQVVGSQNPRVGLGELRVRQKGMPDAVVLFQTSGSVQSITNGLG